MCLNPLQLPNPVLRSGERKTVVSRKLASFMTPLLRSQQPKTITVPCGRCEQCLSSKMSEYRRRISQQLEMTPLGLRNFFFTLTFDDAHLSLITTPSDLRSTFRDFMRRLSYYFFGLSKTTIFPYFCASEFGQHPQTGSAPRLHLHCIIFNLPFPEYFGLGLVNNIISKLWSQGYTWTGWFDGRSCKYVSKYVLKTYEHNEDLHLLMCSQRLGLREDFVKKLSSFTSWFEFERLFPFGKHKVRKYPIKSEIRAAKQFMTGEQLYCLQFFMFRIAQEVQLALEDIRKITKSISLICPSYLRFLKAKSRTCLISIFPGDFLAPRPPLLLSPCL